MSCSEGHSRAKRRVTGDEGVKLAIRCSIPVLVCVGASSEVKIATTSVDTCTDTDPDGQFPEAPGAKIRMESAQVTIEALIVRQVHVDADDRGLDAELPYEHGALRYETSGRLQK